MRNGTARSCSTECDAPAIHRSGGSAERVARGLPAWERTVDPAWFEADPVGAEGWSLKCRFEPTAAEQGNPTLAWVAFLVEAAPHERLAPGARIRLYKRGTRQRADVQILE